MRYLTVILAFFVASCGFTPLYGTQNNDVNITSSLQSVRINPLEGRLGQLITNELIEDLYQTSGEQNTKYELFLDVSEEVNVYGFNQDRSTTRESYAQTINYRLVDIDTQEEVTSGVAIARTSYDVVQSDFSNFSAKQDAVERMVDEISQNITRKLAVFFRNSSE